jgi:predicted acyltransferase
MILVNNPGTWGHIFDPLEHATWHGLTPTDLVFPFFLFAVGNALSFVMPKLETAGPRVFWRKVITRTALIFLIGLFLQWWPPVTEVSHLVPGATELQKETIFKGFRWITYSKDEAGNIVEIVKGVRILGVLQRIALCYFFAAVIIYYFKPKRSFYIGLAILLIYWGLCILGNPSDPYSLGGWFGTDIDKQILTVPHMYKAEVLNGKVIPFDPEGLMSTLPAIVQVIFGYMVGEYIQKKGRMTTGIQNPEAAQGKGFEMLSGLFVAGVALLVTGFCWDIVFPINKKIWTSSFVIYTTGLAILTIATMIYFIEFKHVRGWLARFFDVFGKNALFVFALSAFLPKTLGLIKLSGGGNPWSWLYSRVLSKIPGPPEIGSLLYALCVITFMWLICWWMDKKRIYIKV